MAPKGCATRARIQNITQARKKKKIQIWQVCYYPSPSQTSEPLLPQTAVFDEPTTLDTDDVPNILNKVPNEDLDDSEGSCVKILDGGSDADICEETELMRFSKMLRDTQERALVEEKAKQKKQKTYDGSSQSTAYRQKRHQKKLAAQGYLPPTGRGVDVKRSFGVTGRRA